MWFWNCDTVFVVVAWAMKRKVPKAIPPISPKKEHNFFEGCCSEINIERYRMKIKNLHRSNWGCFLQSRMKTEVEGSLQQFQVERKIINFQRRGRSHDAFCFKIHYAAGCSLYPTRWVCIKQKFCNGKLNLITFYEKLNNYSQTAWRRIVHRQQSIK